MKSTTPKLYWNKDWLLEEYVIFERSLDDIAGQCGVTASSIRNYLDKFDIPVRTKVTHWPLSDWFSGIINNSTSKEEEGRKHTDGWEPEDRFELNSSVEWQELKAIVSERDKTCQRCNKPANSSHVHHILPFHWHIEVLNPKYCILLCSGCHVWVHSIKQNPKMLFLASPIKRRFYFDPRIHQEFTENRKGR